MKIDIEKERQYWAEIAKANGWYKEPFYVQVWVNEEGKVTDSVSATILEQDWVIEEKRYECEDCGALHYDSEDCEF